jgi:hypothetical protein
MTTLLPDSARPARLARLLTEELVAEAAELDARWAAAVRSQFRLPDDETLQVLRAFAARADFGLGVAESARRLWAAAGADGTAEPPAEIAAAVRVFERVGFQARKVEEHRTRPWTPKHPERLARALQDAREGRAYSVDEVREWFRRQEGEATG